MSDQFQLPTNGKRNGLPHHLLKPLAAQQQMKGGVDLSRLQAKYSAEAKEQAEAEMMEKIEAALQGAFEKMDAVSEMDDATFEEALQQAVLHGEHQAWGVKRGKVVASCPFKNPYFIQSLFDELAHRFQVKRNLQVSLLEASDE